MGNRLLLFTSSLILCFSAIAQEGAEPDSAVYRRALIPSIYIDYGKLLTLPSSQETKYEGGIELLFLEKYPLIVEVGAATLNPNQAFSNGTYEATGTYYRIGTGFYSQFTPDNKLGLTFRYGASTFSESARISIESASGTGETVVIPLERPNLSASWFEAVIYSDRQINKLLAVGLNLRLRFLIDYTEQSPVDVYSIPGYGRSFDKSIPAANLFLKVSF